MVKPYIHKKGYQVYGCGHTHKGLIIMDSNALEWANDTGLDGDKSECFDCYLKKQDKERIISRLRA